MREILFRGENKTTGEWVQGDLFHYGEQAFIAANNRNAEILPETLGQFTGLTNRNGVKIFEGDIVTGIAYSQEWVGNIIWIKEIASFGLNHGHDIAWENSSILKRATKGINDEFSAKIIGNIYDNPELLKGEQK